MENIQLKDGQNVIIGSNRDITEAIECRIENQFYRRNNMIKRILNKTIGKLVYNQVRYWVLMKKNKWCTYYHKKNCIDCPYHKDTNTETKCLALDVWQGLRKIEKILP